MKISETRAAWLGILFTMAGLVTSIYYSGHILKVTRMENEMNCYLNLNQRYHKLVYTLVHNKTFRHTTSEELGDDKYVIYEIFDLIATVKTMETYAEMAPELRADWERKIDFLLSKPAVQAAWKTQIPYINNIYSPDFINYIEKRIQ